MRKRLPYNPAKNFEPREFEKFFKIVRETVKILVHNGDLDAYAAFNALMQKNRAITVQAMERKDDHVLMTLQVPEDVDKAVLEKQFDQLKEENYRLRLGAKVSKRLAQEETA